MYFAYFDESKAFRDSPYFWLGGILIKDSHIRSLEESLRQIQYNFFNSNILIKGNEIHGNALFHGKENFKKIKLAKRWQLLESIGTFIIHYKIPIRLICIDIQAHREKYRTPYPEYNLGLMLFLERFCDFLDEADDVGMVYGDEEKDEIAKSIADFSQFKYLGKTPMYYGRPLGRLIDTIYFTKSHHSRFLQVADIIIFLANRYEHFDRVPNKWHEKKAQQIWTNIKKGTDCYIQEWP